MAEVWNHVSPFARDAADFLVILYFFFRKIVNAISRDLSACFFFVSRIFSINLKFKVWLVFVFCFFFEKNIIGAEILKPFNLKMCGFAH